jgi:acylphosphatase
MKKRLHAYYSGTVQGVGFRFTAERIALDLRLHGWVRNLFDGRVEVVCEGEEPDLVGFLDKMKNGPMKHYITNAQVKWREATGEFADFGIKF